MSDRSARTPLEARLDALGRAAAADHADTGPGAAYLARVGQIRLVRRAAWGLAWVVMTTVVAAAVLMRSSGFKAPPPPEARSQESAPQREPEFIP